MYKYVQQLDDDFNPHFDAPPFKYDIDFDDPDSISFRQGLFTLSYPDIEWDEQGQATLEVDDMFLSLPDEDGLFGFDEPFTINRDDVLITLSEFTRFEAEHSFTPMTDQTGSRNTSAKPCPSPTDL